MENLFLILSSVLFAANIALFVGILALRKKFKVLLNGNSGKNLENLIVERLEKLEKINEDLLNLIKETGYIQKMAQKSIQKFAMVRFNPFLNTGGDQSFCIAMMDSENNGCVLTSLYSRDGIRVYAKPVEFGKSSYQLSPEEEEAIGKAIRQS